MGIPNSMMLAIQEIESTLDKEAPIKERLTQAMKLSRNHWLIVDEDQQFRCAVGAVIITASQDERLIIEYEMDVLRALSAGASGVPIDFEALAQGAPETTYGLRGLWIESNNTSTSTKNEGES